MPPRATGRTPTVVSLPRCLVVGAELVSALSGERSRCARPELGRRQAPPLPQGIFAEPVLRQGLFGSSVQFRAFRSQAFTAELPKLLLDRVADERASARSRTVLDQAVESVKNLSIE